MGFNTLPFIFIFLPVFLAVYYLMPERLRNGVLTLGSLVFYLLGTWKRPWCLALLLGLMALTWLSIQVRCLHIQDFLAVSRSAELMNTWKKPEKNRLIGNIGF